MSVDVKCPNVPHRRGKIGQRVRQLRMVWTFSSAIFSFRYKEIALCPGAKTSYTYFQNSVIHKYRVVGDETLHP